MRVGVEGIHKVPDVALDEAERPGESKIILHRKLEGCKYCCYICHVIHVHLF